MAWPLGALAVDQGDTVWVVDEAPAFRQPMGVEVTGTAILNPGSKRALPVQVLERKDIERLGVYTSVALLQRLAVMVNTGDVGLSMLRPGPETAAIHGYEAGTLVLLNGRRLGVYPLQMVSANADLMVPDLGKVPLRAIERVEILTDGASTRYGSDAIAGVLNIITRRPFDGWETGAAVQRPDASGGTESVGGLSWGRGGRPQDSWSVQWHVSWREREQVTAAQRGLTTSERRIMGYNAQGEPVYAGRLSAFSEFGAPAQPASALAGSAGVCSEGYEWLTDLQRCVQNNGAGLMVYPREKQLSLFAAWEQRLSADTHVFADVLINDYTKRLMLGTPMGSVAASDTGQRYLLRVDPLASHIHERTLSRLLTGGVRGTVWGADYKLTLSHTHHLGSGVRTGGAQPGWETGIRLSETELSRHSADYSAQTLGEFGRWRASDQELIKAATQSYQVEGLLSGQWDGDNGLQRRWALGSGFLEDGITSVQNLGTYRASTTLKRRSAAVFAELEADVSERLLAGVALRHDHYSDVGSSSTGKIKAKWRFSSQGFVRFGVGTGFRAPSLRQLDPTSNLSLSMGVDPTATACDFSQGFAGRDRAVLCSGSELYQVGNASLKPERSTHLNLGVRHEPTAQWSWGLDYWSLQVKDIFGALNFNDILADPSLYARYASLPGPGTPERIQLVAQNLGRLDRRGIDYDIHFRQSTDWGRLRMSVGGTYYLRSLRGFMPGQAPVDELGNYVYQTERFVPRSKVRLLLQWDRRNWAYSAIVDTLSGNTETVEGKTASGQSASVTRRVPAHWTLGLMARHTPTPGVDLYFGVDNVFDKLPPLRYASPASQGFVPGLDTRYGSYQGRTFKMGVNLKF